MEFFTIDRASAHDATASGNFGGQVWMQRLITDQHSHDIELLVVSFEAGGRTRPHIHLVDQILHITAGRGIVATCSYAARRFGVPGRSGVPARWTEVRPPEREAARCSPSVPSLPGPGQAPAIETNPGRRLPTRRRRRRRSEWPCSSRAMAAGEEPETKQG